MTLRPIAEVQDLRSQLITSQLRHDLGPREVVDRTRDQDGDARDDVGCVPEADITSIRTTSGWVPWHDQKVQLQQDVEDDDGVPRLEAGVWQVGSLAAPADHIEANGHGKVEGCGGVG